MRSRRARSLLLVLLLFGTARAEEPPGQARDPILRELRFLCTAPVDVAGLTEMLPLRVGEPVGADQLENARRLLERKGIFDAISLDTVARSGGVDVVVRLVRKRVVRRVNVRGYESVSRREIWRLVRVRQEMIFDDRLVEADRQRLLRRYTRIGFTGTEVEVEASDVSRGQVDLSFEIREGEAQTITELVVDGDWPFSGKLPRKVRKLVGKRYTREATREIERALLGRLRDGGYYEADVGSSWEATGVLRVQIDAGQRFELVVVGNQAKSREQLLQTQDLRDRLLVTDATWRELGRRMRRQYQESGYYEAQVKVETDLDENDVPETVILDTEADGNGEVATRWIVFRIQEGVSFSIRSLQFEGNEQIADDRLLDSMATRPRRRFPWPRRGFLIDETLDSDKTHLVALYRAHGFESASVTEVRRDLDPENGHIDLTLVIEEGAKSTVRDVTIDGAQGFDTTAFALRLQPGAPLSDENLRSDRRGILETLSTAGYLQATVEPEVERSPADTREIAVSLRWQVEPGPRQEVGAVIVAGNIDTRDEAILQEVDLVPGEPINTRALLEGQARVYRMGVFRRVSVRPAAEGEGGSDGDVMVSVAERPPGNLRWGGGYNTRDGFGTFLELGYNNVLGMARRLTLRGEMTLKPSKGTPDQYRASLGYVHPRLAGSAWRLHANLRGERNTQSAQPYNLRSAGGAVGVSRALNRRFDGGVEFQAQFLDLFDVKQDVILTDLDEGNSRSVTLTPFLIRDGRNDPAVPTDGSLQTARIHYAIPGLSSAQVMKISLQHTQYLSLPFEIVFSYSGRVGWAGAITGASQVPLADRFFLGGQTTVRGFKENSIGPEGEDGNRAGGDLVLNANVEVQVPLIYGFGAAFFLDGGGLYLVGCGNSCQASNGISDAALTFDNFRRAAGAGLRYLTPVGPVRLDYGIKLDRRSGESFGRVHFGIGLAF